MKPMAEFAALRLLLHTRQPQALHNEFGNINTKEREQIVANHPCGSLAIKYHVPLAVKRIAQIMDRSNLYFCTESPQITTVTTRSSETTVWPLVINFLHSRS